MTRPTGARAFHRWYYGAEAQTWKATTWLGVPVQKLPLDLWLVAELIAAIRPAWVIETGTLHGGSALYYATILEALNHGSVLTIDVSPQTPLPRHRRIVYLRGDAADPATVGAVQALVGVTEPRMVVLDSDHHAPHVLAELRAYSPLVTVGSMLVVEDTNLNGHPVVPDFGPGPTEAIAQWFADDKPPFVVDPVGAKFGVTFHPGGFLRREGP